MRQHTLRFFIIAIILHSTYCVPGIVLITLQILSYLILYKCKLATQVGKNTGLAISAVTDLLYGPQSLTAFLWDTVPLSINEERR